MGGNQKSLGRNWMTADEVSATNYGDCTRLDVRWNDGAYAYLIFEGENHPAQAAAEARSLGFI